MTPVLLHGRVVWDQNVFPRDECEERLRLVQSAMQVDALVVGGAKGDFADLCFLTQFVPYAAWALAIVPAHGDMTLITGVGGGRELPASRARTWVGDVRNLPNLGPALLDLLAERMLTQDESTPGLKRGVQGGAAPPGQRTLGLVGLDTLPQGLERRLRATLQEAFACQAADQLMASLRATLRSREISAVRLAAAIAHAAARDVEQAHTQGASNAAAMIAGERQARRLGALDVRSLVNLEGDTLAPIEDISDYRSEPLIGYLAVNHLGYWADVAITAGPTDQTERAHAALSAMVEAARPGVSASDLARLASQHIPHAQDLGWGNAIGLSLSQPPLITIDSTQTLVEDSIVSLRARLPHAFVSDVVRITPTGGVSLWP